MERPRRKPIAEAAEQAAQPPTASDLSAIVARFFAARRTAPGQTLRVCVALSGGRDSVVLLHALSALAASGVPLAVSALHVHHGISANADAWAAFCAAFCQHCAVPLLIVRVVVPQGSGEGPEGAARRMRHAAFAECAADFLALAHHRDDQAETVLLNLLRGAGVAGAAGMLAERPQAHGPALVRPLLDVPRVAIERYAGEYALDFISDESNDDEHFRRNYLRRAVIPRLDERFPGASRSLARAASHCAEASLLLDELAASDRAALSAQSGRVDLAAFNALTAGRARNLLRWLWVDAGFRAPDTRWVDEALRQLANAGALSETCVATVDGELHVYRGQLHIVGHAPALSTPALCTPTLSWSGEAQLPWAGGQIRFVSATGAGLRRSLLATADVWLAFRHGGERLQPDARRPRRTVRNLLREAAIPPWERARLPLLWCAGQLVWVAGVGVDAAFACPIGEAGIIPTWEADARSPAAR